MNEKFNKFVGTLKPNEVKTVELPIRFVYTDMYKLYVQ